jgi:hypothetical protein
MDETRGTKAGLPASPAQYMPPVESRTVDWRRRPDFEEPAWWPAWTAFAGLALSFCIVGGLVGLVGAIAGATLLRRQSGPAATLAIVFGILAMIIAGMVIWSSWTLCRTTCD